MNDSRRRIDIISEPGFLSDIEEIDVAELRRRRTMCAAVETELSYYRRLLHGRVDLLRFERRRRSGEETRSVIDALPEILGDAPRTVAPHVTLATAVTDPPHIPGPGRRSIDFVLGDDFLARLSDLNDEELEDIEAKLEAEEAAVSQQRGTAQGALDAISDEIGRRYRLGLTSVDELLRD
jgi:hypothetical protein